MSADQASTPQRVRFDYIKSNLFRIVHADGVVGGPSPKGMLTMSFFNERVPIPQQISHEVTVDESTHTAKLGAEVTSERIARNAVIREVEVGVVMDYTTAVALHSWLSGHIETLKSIEMRKREEPVE